MMSNTRTFEIVESSFNENCVEVWLPPVNDPEGELIIQSLHKDYLNSLVADVINYIRNSGEYE